MLCHLPSVFLKVTTKCLNGAITAVVQIDLTQYKIAVNYKMMQDGGTSVWRKCTVFSKIEVEKAQTARLMTFDTGSYQRVQMGEVSGGK